MLVTIAKDTKQVGKKYHRWYRPKGHAERKLGYSTLGGTTECSIAWSITWHLINSSWGRIPARHRSTPAGSGGDRARQALNNLRPSMSGLNHAVDVDFTTGQVRGLDLANYAEE